MSQVSLSVSGVLLTSIATPWLSHDVVVPIV